MTVFHELPFLSLVLVDIMAVNMNERDQNVMIFSVFIVFCSTFYAASAVTAPSTSETTIPATQTPTVNSTLNGTTNESTTEAPTTPVPTSPTTTVTTTTTTTIAPLQAPTVWDANSLIGKCPCDLTGNGCDVNCCCDPDCTADDKLTFSQCLPFSTNVDNRLCVRDEVIAFENSDPVISEVTDDDLFCIYYDNREKRNYYVNPDKVETLAEFDQYRKEFPAFSFQSSPGPAIDFNSAFYQSGDPVYTVSESGTIGVLGLPKTLTTTECVDENPTAYLTEETNRCVRTLTNLAAVCQAGAQGMDVNNFLQGFRVVTSPRLFQELNTSSIDSLYNNSLTIAVELDTRTAVNPVQCYDDTSGLTAPCGYSTSPLPSPTPGSNVCEKIVKEVHYTVVTDGTAGIVRVLARVVLTDLTVPDPSSAQRFQQTFSAAFEASGSSSEQFERSGNPGYVVGQPVLAGTRNQTTDTDPVTEQIFLSSSRDRYMTVVKSSASGDCFTDSESRMPVLFGQNVRTGCLLRVSATNLSEYCTLMQQKIINTMEFDSIPEGVTDPAYYVALYGNSDVSKPGDWVQVVSVNRIPPSNPTPQTSGCSLRLGMHIQILYANIGALVNPQAKIIAVSYIYDSLTSMKIRPTLTGEYNQPVEVTASVSFIDVSKPAAKKEGEAPIFLAKLPYDFFYPFISGASVPRPLPAVFLPLLLIWCWISS